MRNSMAMEEVTFVTIRRRGSRLVVVVVVVVEEPPPIDDDDDDDDDGVGVVDASLELAVGVFRRRWVAVLSMRGGAV